MTQYHSIELSDSVDQQNFDVEIITPHGKFNLRGSLVDSDQAFVLFIDTTENDEPLEPTPDVLRVNVNDGPVFNYDDAVNWYGEGRGIEAPILADDSETEV